MSLFVSPLAAVHTFVTIGESKTNQNRKLFQAALRFTHNNIKQATTAACFDDLLDPWPRHTSSCAVTCRDIRQVWTEAQEDLRLLLNPLRPPGCVATHGWRDGQEVCECVGICVRVCVCAGPRGGQEEQAVRRD